MACIHVHVSKDLREIKFFLKGVAISACSHSDEDGMGDSYHLVKEGRLDCHFPVCTSGGHSTPQFIFCLGELSPSHLFSLSYNFLSLCFDISLARVSDV